MNSVKRWPDWVAGNKSAICKICDNYQPMTIPSSFFLNDCDGHTLKVIKLWTCLLSGIIIFILETSIWAPCICTDHFVKQNLYNMVKSFLDSLAAELSWMDLRTAQK